LLNNASEVEKVRRFVYLLLAVFLVQLSGLRAACAPASHQTHACCPAGGKTTRQNSSPLPDCCISSILNCQGSIAEARNFDGPSAVTFHAGIAQVPSDVPLIAITAEARQQVLPPISSHRSPLSQSCLLLI
jgi:hypothetical protein